jgi:hypothetical protein
LSSLILFTFYWKYQKVKTNILHYRFLFLPQDQQINILSESSSHWSSFHPLLRKLKEKDEEITILEYEFVNSGLLDPDTIQQIRSKKQQIEIKPVNSHEDTVDSLREKIQLNEQKIYELNEKCRKEYIEHNLRNRVIWIINCGVL